MWATSCTIHRFASDMGRPFLDAVLCTVTTSVAGPDTHDRAALAMTRHNITIDVVVVLRAHCALCVLTCSRRWHASVLLERHPARWYARPSEKYTTSTRLSVAARTRKWSHPEQPKLFEGLRFDFTKVLNQRFPLSHRLYIASKVSW